MGIKDGPDAVVVRQSLGDRYADVLITGDPETTRIFCKYLQTPEKPFLQRLKEYLRF